MALEPHRRTFFKRHSKPGAVVVVNSITRMWASGCHPAEAEMEMGPYQHLLVYEVTYEALQTFDNVVC